MKFIAPIILLLLVPFRLQAQPDYCTCMEENRQYEDLMQYFSSTVDISIQVQQQSPNYYIPEEDPKPTFVPMYMNVNNFPTATAVKEEVVEKEEEPTPEVEQPAIQVVEKPVLQERRITERTGTNSRAKGKIKRKRKRLKGKIKRKKKFKKYKGGCPFF